MYQAKLKLVHPNAKNTGTSVEMYVRPASNIESGGLMVTFTPQRTLGGTVDGKRTFPTFDYEHKLVVKLTMFEVAQMCMVLDGKAESVGDGKGFFHKSPKGTTVVGLSHLNEKINGFWFFVSRKPSEGKEQKMGIFISLIEAYALSISLKQAMFYMGFGTPDTWPTAKELTANSEKKNVQ